MQAIKEFGQIDCLINNAGWHPPPMTIDKFSIEDMQDLFQVPAPTRAAVPPSTRVGVVAFSCVEISGQRDWGEAGNRIG